MSPSHGGADRNKITTQRCLLVHCRPLTGARIETRKYAARRARPGVALSRGRGSKQERLAALGVTTESPSHGGADRNEHRQAPFHSSPKSPSHGGADRNTRSDVACRKARWSPSHGGADRNRENADQVEAQTRSPSHGGADRNCGGRTRLRNRPSRPLTGARIETSSCARSMPMVMSPSHGGADRNRISGTSRLTNVRSPSHGGADRNLIERGKERAHKVALSRGRGSKLVRARHDAAEPSRPLTGARIETG